MVSRFFCIFIFVLVLDGLFFMFYDTLTCRVRCEIANSDFVNPVPAATLSPTQFAPRHSSNHLMPLISVHGQLEQFAE
jgi:hypothetical protein